MVFDCQSAIDSTTIYHGLHEKDFLVLHECYIVINMNRKDCVVSKDDSSK